MHPVTVKVGSAVSGVSFIALVLSGAGWALLTACLVTMGARAGAHAALALPALALAGLSIHCPPGERQGFRGRWDAVSRRNRLFTIANVGWALLLLVAGGILGALVLHAGVLILAMASSALVVAPWARVHLCRDHFIPACLVVWLGLAGVLGLGDRAIGFMTFPTAGWVFWSCASAALLWRAARRWKAERSASKAATSR